MKTIHIIVNGRVQGVYFRAFTQKKAIKLGVRGFVRNKADGAVEIVAQADQPALDIFIKYCQKGSLMAKVNDIKITDYTVTNNFSKFEIC